MVEMIMTPIRLTWSFLTLSTFVGLCGLIGILMFELDWYWPLWFSIAILCGLMFHCAYSVTTSRFSLLWRLYAAAYFLPFVHLIPYLWFRWDERRSHMWGLVSNDYMFDHGTIALLAMTATIGGLGYLLGGLIVTCRKRAQSKCSTPEKSHQKMPLSLWGALLTISVFLSWLSAPEQTILTAAYTESEAAAPAMHFSAAWMVSYAILVVLFVEMWFRPAGLPRKTMIGLFGAAVALIVVWLQFLRGDRESIALVLAIASMWVTFRWGLADRAAIPRSRILLMGAAAMAVYLAAFAVQHSRFILKDSGISGAFSYLAEYLTFDDALSGTWSAVLLSPLSVIGDYVQDIAEPPTLGTRTLDIFLSLPPQFLADLFGYQRPLDVQPPLGWSLTHGLGGLHPTVLSFLEFRMLGVFGYMLLTGMIIAWIELKVDTKRTKPFYCVFGIMAMAGLHWFWYGEKNGINGFILCALALAGYTFLDRKLWKRS